MQVAFLIFLLNGVLRLQVNVSDLLWDTLQLQGNLWHLNDVQLQGNRQPFNMQLHGNFWHLNEKPGKYFLFLPNMDIIEIVNSNIIVSFVTTSTYSFKYYQ